MSKARVPLKEFKTLRAEHIDTVEKERAVAEERELLDVSVALQELREQRHVTQEVLAEALSLSRPRVSQIENLGSDLRVSTLARYVEALGGNLQLIANFDDEQVPIGPST